MKELYKFFYDVSLGAWLTSLYIVCRYDNPIPVSILVVVMGVFYILKEKY